MKSAAIDPAKPHAGTNAVLCTPDQTFELRQVQSSNILYVLQSSATEHTGQTVGVSAVSQCKGLLELVPQDVNAVSYLQQRLPIYGTPASSSYDNCSVKLGADAPFSDKQLQQAKIKLCVVENDGKCWIPPPKLLLAIWQSLLRAIDIKGIKIDKSWNTKPLEDIVTDDGYAVIILHAIIRKVAKEVDDSTFIFQNANEITSWLGAILLASFDGSPLPKEEFMLQWRDMLPEPWRDSIQAMS